MSARLRLPARLPELFADDRALLARFAERGDDAAFAALVKRHGGMVLGVCRRAVRDAHLAEDAFQAVFLVLSRNPQAAARATSVAGWLFGIARRVGLAARRHEQRREKRERRATEPRPSESTHEWDDLLRVVDEELAKIPEANRAALIACFLREQTHDEAARELGWSLSTLRRRLDRGKELLRARLTRRGATLSAGLFAGLLAPSSASAVPRELAARAGQEALASSVALNLAGTALALGNLVPALLAMLVVAGIAMVFGRPEAPAATVSNREDASGINSVPAPSREWVTVVGQVLFPENREVPERREIAKTDGFVKDAECCFADGRRLFFDNAIIEPKTRAIANAVVWLRPDLEAPKASFPLEKIHPKLAKAEAKERTIDVVECQFRPRITVARAGDKLLFENTAPLATNVRYNITEKGPGAKFGEFNVLLAAKTGSTKSPGALERGNLPDIFSSSIYPWMKGYVWAFDHPYAAVTDAQGKFSIPNAPIGTWRLAIWHEEFGFSGNSTGTVVKIADGPDGTTDLGKREFKIKDTE